MAMTASEIALIRRFQRHTERKIAERKQIGQLEVSPNIRISQTVYFGGKFARVMRNGKGYLAKTLLRKSLGHIFGSQRAEGGCTRRIGSLRLRSLGHASKIFIYTPLS